MTFNVGDHLPDFALLTDTGETLAAKDLTGKKVVLYFYPKDDTPQCTKQAQAFRDAVHEFTAAGAIIIGVSVDKVGSHSKFKAKHGLNFMLVADVDAVLARRMGVWVEKSMYGKRYMGVERSTFLIDSDGVIRKVWRKVKVPGHAGEVLEAARLLCFAWRSYAGVRQIEPSIPPPISKPGQSAEDP